LQERLGLAKLKYQHGQLHALNSNPRLESDKPSAEPSSLIYHGSSDDENEPDLPLYNFQNMSFKVESFSLRTPPPKHAHLSCNNRMSEHEGGAKLRYLANSPLARVAAGSPRRAFPPSKPPSEHVVLPLTPNHGTPGQHFNFADFVNVTPSPTQPVRLDRSPCYLGHATPSAKDCRKLLDDLTSDNTLRPDGRLYHGSACN
jgi:hypothetical protein